MNQRRFHTVILGGLIAASPALASQTTDTAIGAEDDVNASTEVVCRIYPAPTGSRIGAQRVCKTQLQWNTLDRETRFSIEQSQVNRCNPRGGSGPCQQ